MDIQYLARGRGGLNVWAQSSGEAGVGANSSATLKSLAYPGGDDGALTWSSSWVPGSTVHVDSAAHIRAAFTSLFVTVMSNITGESVERESGCPVLDRLDAWTPLRVAGLASSFSPRPNASATAPSGAEIVGVARISEIYTSFRDALLLGFSNRPAEFQSEHCLFPLALPVVAACLTSAAASASAAELLDMGSSGFSIFTSLGQFKHSVCAATIVCHVWAVGHWPARGAVSVEAGEQPQPLQARHTPVLPNVFTAIASAGDPTDGLRGMLAFRETAFAYHKLGRTNPRYRRRFLSDGSAMEFDFATGGYALAPPPRDAAASQSPDTPATHSPLKLSVELPPSVFFRRVLKACRSVVLAKGGPSDVVLQRFPSVVEFNGDSVFRGLFFAAVQRLRESGPRSASAGLGRSGFMSTLTPVMSFASHGVMHYFAFVAAGHSSGDHGLVDVMLSKNSVRDTTALQSDRGAQYVARRAECAKYLAALVRRSTHAAGDTNHGTAGGGGDEHPILPPATLQAMFLRFLLQPIVGLRVDGTLLVPTFDVPDKQPAESSRHVLEFIRMVCEASATGVASRQRVVARRGGTDITHRRRMLNLRFWTRPSPHRPSAP